AENAVRRPGAALRRRRTCRRAARDDRIDRRALSRALSLLPLRQARCRHAGDLTEPACRLLHGHSGAAREHADLGHRSRRRGVRRHSVGAGRVRAFQHGLHRAEGVSRRGRRRFRQRARRGGRRADHRRCGGARRLLSAGRFQGHCGLRGRAGRAVVHAVGNFRRNRAEEGLNHAPLIPAKAGIQFLALGPRFRGDVRRTYSVQAKLMRFIFKTDYAQDIRLFQHGGQVFWYGLLLILLLLAPYLVSGYVLSQLHFICIYSIVGLGLMLLVGYTGQISLGHAAFLAVGAYTEALLQGAGVPFVISLGCAALFSAVVGIIVGLPALRLKGIYLAIATFAFNVIVEEIITRWESVTGGNSGKLLKPIELFGLRLGSQESFYYLCLALTVLS